MYSFFLTFQNIDVSTSKRRQKNVNALAENKYKIEEKTKSETKILFLLVKNKKLNKTWK